MSDQSNPKDFPFGNSPSNNDLTDSQSQQPDQQNNQQNIDTNQANATGNNTDGYNTYDQSNGQYSTYVNNGQNQQVPYNNQYQQPGQQNFQQTQPQYQQQYQQPQQQNYQQPPNYNNQQPYNGQDQYYGQAQNGNYPNYQNNPYQQQPIIYRGSKTNTKSIIALILGIASISVPYVGFFIGIAGIILSAMALKEIPRKNEDGRGLAIGGLVTSILGTLLYGIIFIFVIGVFMFAMDTGNNMYY
ncbi:DUF4190 domain-containing protein [Paenibacillus endoradicis]|uniref:DUF4190 domain-containing protein n=1 Tax=Paenibacillus endoradicis TaxID=2972487 RepID=UPI0021591077|nr:DUF4190 domain-containing protein [Paenibacillus endoradicis]MCR8657333.1 DUF4190 domain-containing protein [Paenibacillus endoradicis]